MKLPPLPAPMPSWAGALSLALAAGAHAQGTGTADSLADAGRAPLAAFYLRRRLPEHAGLLAAAREGTPLPSPADLVA